MVIGKHIQLLHKFGNPIDKTPFEQLIFRFVNSIEQKVCIGPSLRSQFNAQLEPYPGNGLKHHMAMPLQFFNQGVDRDSLIIPVPTDLALGMYLPVIKRREKREHIGFNTGNFR
jgi:hypothetical protein